MLDLILECSNNKAICLVGNPILIEEMSKYQVAFDSPTASALLLLLKQKTQVIIPKNQTIIECKKYFPETQFKDVLHTATAMEMNAVLVTNDKHFNKM
ncbi:MAG: putative nucleic acid-binding protein, contains PIN domain [Promethearchaeota archaeon CR_4]|nr:MAG: putative nucleic acid-binding protein, contains PIN domain [Candidatus Lokiarchaeota archaeon CR_4]